MGAESMAPAWTQQQPALPIPILEQFQRWWKRLAFIVSVHALGLCTDDKRMPLFMLPVGAHGQLADHKRQLVQVGEEKPDRRQEAEHLHACEAKSYSKLQ